MLLTKLAKNSEFTYGVHKDVLADVAPDNAFTIMAQADLLVALKHLDQGVMGSVRALNHLKELLRQGIAYGLTYRVSTDPVYPILGAGSLKPVIQFAVYKRNKRNNEGQLTSKLSLGAGGHIEGDDISYHLLRLENSDEVIPTGNIDMLETIDDSFVREYVEEVKLATPEGNDLTSAILGASSATGFQKVGFVMDSKPEPGYVGNIHFGVVYVQEAPAQVASFEMREPQNEAVAWATAEELQTLPLFTDPEVPFEPWSVMIVEQIQALEEYVFANFLKPLTTVPSAVAAASA